MRWALDHIVLVTTDLGASIETYRAAGFSVVPGGRHQASGAANALISLSDLSYLELFSFVDPWRAAPTHANWPAFARGGGLVSYWVNTHEIDADVKRLRASGFEIEEPRHGSRTREDGIEVGFRLAVPPRARHPELPALIEDVTPHSVRVPPFAPHANGATHIRDMTVVLPTLEPARQFARFLEEADPAAGSLASHVVRLGRATITFAAAGKATGEMDAADDYTYGLASVTLDGRNGAMPFPLP